MTLEKKNEDLQKLIDENDISKIEDELKASIKSLDAILENMETDDTIDDSLKALEKEIEGLEQTIGEKEKNVENSDEKKDDGTQEGGKKRRRRTRKKRSLKKSHRKSRKYKTRKH